MTLDAAGCPQDDPHSECCCFAFVARSIHLGDAGHMLRRLTQLVVGLVFLLGVFVGVVLGGMRSKSPPVLNAVRRFNRSVSNPRQMATAGSPGAYASVIRHVGRTSGREYETPIGAIATEDGFVVALPYGANADWLKNLLASGSASIVNEGSTYRVDQPEVVHDGRGDRRLPGSRSGGCCGCSVSTRASGCGAPSCRTPDAVDGGTQAPFSHCSAGAPVGVCSGAKLTPRRSSPCRSSTSRTWASGWAHAPAGTLAGEILNQL